MPPPWKRLLEIEVWADRGVAIVAVWVSGRCSKHTSGVITEAGLVDMAARQAPTQVGDYEEVLELDGGLGPLPFEVRDVDAEGE